MPKTKPDVWSGLMSGGRGPTKPDTIVANPRTLTHMLDLDALEQYLLSCFRRRDWHGVSDAANDLRVLEARYGR